MKKALFLLLFSFSPLLAYDEFAAYTIPKSGSHLLDCTLRLMTNRANFFYIPPRSVQSLEVLADRIHYLHSINRYEMSHLPYDAKEDSFRRALNCKIFFNIRDPRDVTLSFVDYIDKGAVIEGAERQRWNLLSRNQKISYVLEKVHGVGIYTFIQSRLSWMDSPQTLVVKFENLVGEKGGGSNELQRTELQKIAHHIGLQLTDQKLEFVGQNLFGWGGTFNKGLIGRWKEEFTPEHIALSNQLFKDLYSRLGYELAP